MDWKTVTMVSSLKSSGNIQTCNCLYFHSSVLGINRDDINLKEMSRAYRKLARKWHPDMHQGEEAKQEATIKFRLVATAYEVLRDEESRKDYDYMLDNPEEMYAHYYRYYRRMYAPKVDVRIVILVVITLISAYQYYASHSKYKEAIDYFVTVPKYRMKAQEIATDEGIWPNPTQTSEGKSRVKLRGPNKSKLKDIVRGEEEAVIRKVIEEKMDIKGSYEKPTWRDLLWAQIFLLPVVLCKTDNVLLFVFENQFHSCRQLHLLSCTLAVQVHHQQSRAGP